MAKHDLANESKRGGCTLKLMLTAERAGLILLNPKLPDGLFQPNSIKSKVFSI